ncbi:hypothetical protein ACRS5S_17415 [Nocardia asiatica]|uniref:hypothetical protein n=1 Tax=Nocardia asiatica TaxID=209252 RepID=UPI0012F86409|nr:hypothetical protein [Nocardia asiatica]
MSDNVTAIVPDGCGAACGPWITVEQLNLFTFRQETGEVLSVKCPSMNCSGQMVKVVNGRMAVHGSPMAIAPGDRKCPWIGIRVVCDRTRHLEVGFQPAPPPVQPPQAGR